MQLLCWASFNCAREQLSLGKSVIEESQACTLLSSQRLQPAPGAGFHHQTKSTAKHREEKIQKQPIFMLFGCSLLSKTSGLVMLDSSQGDEGQGLKHFIGDTSFKVLLPLPSTLQRRCLESPGEGAACNPACVPPCRNPFSWR